MYNNYDYPMGADTPNAPWNQSDPDPVEVSAVVSVTLSKSVTLEVDDYTANAWEDFDTGDEGEVIHTGGVEYDFSECDLKSAYEEQHYTLPELMNKCRSFLLNRIIDLKNNADTLDDNMKSEKNALLLEIRSLDSLVKGLDDWVVDDQEIVIDD